MPTDRADSGPGAAGLSSRFWRFSIVALAGTLLVIGTLFLTFDEEALEALTTVSTDKNAALAQSILKATNETLHEVLSRAPAESILERRRRAADSPLDLQMTDYLFGLEVFKVNVFDTGNVVRYSTDSAIVGIRLPMNQGVRDALAGQTVSDLVRAGEFNEHDQQTETRNLVQTYVPVPDASGDIVGVLEVYSDITGLMADLARSRTTVTYKAMLILALFLSVLIWLYARIDRSLVARQKTARRYLEQIEGANTVLAERFSERSRLLDEARNFVQSTIDGMPDPAFVIDAEYRITSTNTAARAAFDIDPEPGAAIVCYRALFGRTSPCDNSGGRCALQTGKACSLIETERGDEGDERQIQYRTTPLRNPDGQITGAIEVIHDLSENERAALRFRKEKEEAELAGRVKAAFFARMSHEIRTPMNAVLGMTDLLRLTDLTRKQENYVRTIQSSGSMLTTLLDNVVDYVGIGEGALELEEHDFFVSDLLDNVLDIMGYAASAKNMELVGILDVEPSLVVTGDRYRLRQLLVNLVSNAINFSESGDVVVRVEQECAEDVLRTIRITVEDHGPGIPDAVRARVLRPAGKSSVGAHGIHRGDGLGLVICKEIVDRMGGTIEIKSQPGFGTAVSIIAPFRVAATDRSNAQDFGALRGQRVLVINHSDVVGVAVCRAAKSLGMCCELVRDGETALERLRSAVEDAQPFSSVVLDCRGAYSSELAIARSIRAIEGLELVPIVMLAPIAKPVLPGQISSIGKIRCLNKPLQFAEFRQTLFRMAVHPANDTFDAYEDPGDGMRDLKVLVAEDNPVNLQVMVGLLESLGVHPDCVNNGQSVIDRLEIEPYDVILMDCQMPGLDGGEVTARIRADERRFPNQPLIVAVTADTTLEHRAQCLEAGMDDFFPKPVRLDKLRLELARWRRRLSARGTVVGDGPVAGQQDMMERLKARTGSRDSGFLSRYIDLFLQDSSARLARLTEAVDSKDVESVRRECHSLKGACLEFGSDRMARLCDELRARAASGKLGRGADDLSNLKREFERIRPVFEHEYALDSSSEVSKPDR